MRLINADVLLAELEKSHFPGAPSVDTGINIAIKKVRAAPTIEPRKGKWVYPRACRVHFSTTKMIRECTVCRQKCDGGLMPFRFCPNCGADMREDDA